MVYIDTSRNRYGRMIMSHMAADTLDELHSFAELLGLRREWFQDKRLPHYDICQSKKRLALSMGATEVSSRELVRIIRSKLVS